ncbi:MAG TPA: IS5 family transposase [Pyrinomonadaceae bacterium]|nr:IS5 family transposase [Pyrinomonadaceae bacterium]
MFQARLDQQLNPQHPLFQLSQQIDWSYFEREFGPLYAEEVGRPGVPTRLLVGLHYLKHTYDESDELVVEKWVENPYWQYFCGYEFFQHELPCHPTSLVKWRGRIKAEGVEKMLREVLSTAVRSEALDAKDLERVNVDTTVQEKAVAFPTDARLYEKARLAVVREAQKASVKLRQSYKRVGKKALYDQSRYARARQIKRAKREAKKLRNYLGRVLRDVERKLPDPSPKFKELLKNAARIHRQEKNDSPKLYSVHAPEVECIAKGKAHKKYEFGCKVALVTTSKSNWVVGIEAHHGNPYDGATLKASINQTERLTGVRPKEAFVDRGYRGKEHHPEDVKVHITGQHKASRALKRHFKRRNAIEPVIGHEKQDHGLGRNHLKGKEGDRINALLAGCGFNLRKLLRAFSCVLRDWLSGLVFKPLTGPPLFRGRFSAV